MKVTGICLPPAKKSQQVRLLCRNLEAVRMTNICRCMIAISSRRPSFYINITLVTLSLYLCVLMIIKS